jgi:hypothetical protein
MKGRRLLRSVAERARAMESLLRQECSETMGGFWPLSHNTYEETKRHRQRRLANSAWRAPLRESVRPPLGGILYRIPKKLVGF